MASELQLTLNHIQSLKAVTQFIMFVYGTIASKLFNLIDLCISNLCLTFNKMNPFFLNFPNLNWKGEKRINNSNLVFLIIAIQFLRNNLILCMR